MLMFLGDDGNCCAFSYCIAETFACERRRLNQGERGIKLNLVPFHSFTNDWVTFGRYEVIRSDSVNSNSAFEMLAQDSPEARILVTSCNILQTSRS